MSNLSDVISCLKKIKKKNLGQNKDNSINYLNKDYDYSKESAIEAVEKAVKENLVKIVLFNVKDSYRNVDKDDNTILALDTRQNEPESIETISESDNLNIEETLVDTPTPISNSERILVLERRLEEFSRSIENRLLSIEDQIIGPCDTNKKSNNMSDNVFCLDLLKNWVVDLERQTTEKDAIISFLSKQLINKNRYGDSCNGTTVNDHNGSFHERAEIINNNFPLGQDNKQDKGKNVIIVGDSILNKKSKDCKRLLFLS